MISSSAGSPSPAASTLFASSSRRPGWPAPRMLGVAKILENMEIGHNVMHGQWDWMNDPEIHSHTWEWDTIQPAEQWKHSHNYIHHTFTNVLGNDKRRRLRHPARDPRPEVEPGNLGQPVCNALLALLFQWGVALHDLDIETIQQGRAGPRRAEAPAQANRAQGPQAGRQGLRALPAADRAGFVTTLTANATANLMRNLWAYMIIFCGHFPDGARTSPRTSSRTRRRPSGICARCSARPTSPAAACCTSWPATSATRSSTTCSPTCRATATPRSPSGCRRSATSTTCPYTTGPLYKQYGQALRTVMRLTLPNRWTGLPEVTDPRRSRQADAPDRTGEKELSAAA